MLKVYRQPKHPRQVQTYWVSRYAPYLISLLFFASLYLVGGRGNARSDTVQRLQQSSIVPSWTPNLAQVLPTNVLAQQGNQIVVNGQTLPGAWSLRQQRIGISDAGFVQTVGISLLNNSDPARQPVQWFSDPALQPLVTETWLTSQFRYLDITELSQRLGWQVAVEGAALRINTPTARVMGVRQGKQSWGDRIVVDLDQPTPWRVVEQNGSFTVTVDGAIDPALGQRLVGTAGNNITAFTVTSSGKQTQLQVTVSGGLRPRISTLPTPNRIVIDIRPDSMGDRNLVWAPGLRWQQQIVSVGNARFPVVLLEIDPRQAGLTLKPIWSDPNSAVGTAPLITTAQRWQAAAAINAGFFNRNNQLPLGAIKRDNRWISGPILNRGAIAWNDNGEVTMGRLSLQESVTTAGGDRIPVFALNSGYVGAGLSVYTPDWGANYTTIADNEVVITVRGNQVVQQRPAGAAGQTAPIPSDGYLLVSRATEAIARSLSVGTTVNHQIATAPADFNRFPNVIGAGPLLVQNGQIVLNPEAEQFTRAFITESAVRSAIGRKTEGTLIIVSAQNRLGGRGPTLGEMAQIMQRLGSVSALNLDGGSSTSLYLGGQLLNRAPRTAARVHNGIGVFLQPGY